ncbi:MAG: hypothetical protein E7404_08430 [Ruminococcaceae bacterium]|nr:hypothetical protein [Oscillospiraceae bacterium]
MLSNVPSSILLLLLILMPVIAVVVIVSGTIWGIYKARKNNSPNKKKIILLSILAILIAAVSWILNMGWIRFVMTFMLIPFIHAIIFFFTNLFMASYVDKTKNIKILNLLFIMTYLLLYIFLPDAADYGEMYFLFGLIHNDLLSNIAYAISSISFLGHIVLFVLQIIYAVKTKRKQIDNSGI